MLPAKVSGSARILQRAVVEQLKVHLLVCPDSTTAKICASVPAIVTGFVLWKYSPN